MDLFDPPTPSDPLGEALHHLRMSGAFYCRTEVTAPWGITLPALPGYLWFHVVTSGALHLEPSGDESFLVGAGGLALVTHGAGHTLRSDPEAPAPGILELEREEVSDRYEILRHGGGGALTRLVCGAVRFDHPAARNLVAALPELIRIEALTAPDIERMQATLGLIAAETMQPRPGGEAVITRLADVLVIQAIRAWIETDPGARTGWLGALQRAGRRTGDALRDAPTHAVGSQLAQRGRSDGRRGREPAGIPIAGRVRAGVQARRGARAGRDQTRPARRARGSARQPGVRPRPLRPPSARDPGRRSGRP